MEELILTDPVVKPAETTNKYHVVSLTLDMEYAANPAIVGSLPGLILINLKDNNNARSNYRYEGKPATDMIKFLNTANLSVKSMHKRILEKLSADGLLPGTVTGAPDGATAEL